MKVDNWADSKMESCSWDVLVSPVSPQGPYKWQEKEGQEGQNDALEISPMDQWIWTPNGGGLGSICGQGTKIPHTTSKTWCAVKGMDK